MKRFNKARIRCAVVVYEEIIAFCLERKRKKNYSIFNVFMQFLIHFVDWNVENFQHGTNSMSSRLLRRDYCCFPNEQNLKLAPKMTKTPKFSKFQRFYAFYPKFTTDLVDSSVEKCQQGMNMLSSRLFWRDYCFFPNAKISKWHWKWQKSKNFPKFKVLMPFFSKFSTDLVDSSVEKC